MNKEKMEENLINEHKFLVEHLVELDNFINSEEFNDLQDVERADLICQEHAMVLYERFLGSRMIRFGIGINKEPANEKEDEGTKNEEQE